ncbi:GTP-binding protein RAD-like [Saccostrea echinata]|uniref:GTP-binding protein RAD-like n=1 Tax=Saccostrea echinata TaxID=191078 RepID=UPI002A8127D4|nr:GTP-binding protein RAD-like [Saccostrea echinata]
MDKTLLTAHRNLLTVDSGYHGRRRNSATLLTPGVSSPLLQVRQNAPRRNSMPENVYLNGDNSLDLERVRSFRMTKSGIVNRGDRIRRKSTTSISSAGSNVSGASYQDVTAPHPLEISDGEMNSDPECFSVAILGAQGVGKKTLKTQFMTSEAICTSNTSIDADDEEATVPVKLDEEESNIRIIEVPDLKSIEDLPDVDAILVVYSVDDEQSFKEAVQNIQFIRKEVANKQAIILVANKADLERRRVVSEKEAKAVSDRYHCKYVEISVVLNHNVDELLVGIVRQVRLRRNSIELEVPTLAPTKMSKSFSSKTKSFLCKLFKVGQKENSSNNLYDL